MPEEPTGPASGSNFGSGSHVDLALPASSGHELDLLGPGVTDEEEEDIDNFMAAGGSEPKMKEDIRDWHEL